MRKTTAQNRKTYTIEVLIKSNGKIVNQLRHGEYTDISPRKALIHFLNENSIQIRPEGIRTEPKYIGDMDFNNMLQAKVSLLGGLREVNNYYIVSGKDIIGVRWNV